MNKYSLTSSQKDADSLQHSNVREIGPEWICFQSFGELALDQVLVQVGFSDQHVSNWQNFQE